MRLEEATEILEHNWTQIFNPFYKEELNNALNIAVKALNQIKHAHWIESSEDGALFCSKCGKPTYDTHDEFKEFMGTKIIALVRPYYCGYCGAKMDEVTE